jgi:hypothetical protein
LWAFLATQDEQSKNISHAYSEISFYGFFKDCIAVCKLGRLVAETQKLSHI